VAHEVAHRDLHRNRRGIRLIAFSLGFPLSGWAMAVLLGRIPLELAPTRPEIAWASAFPAALFGTMVYLAAAYLHSLHLDRKEERRCDRRAIEMVGADAMIEWFERDHDDQPLPRSKLYHVHVSSHPTDAERLATARRLQPAQATPAPDMTVEQPTGPAAE
jgi:Zn-dependent protease with chaperone function